MLLPRYRAHWTLALRVAALVTFTACHRAKPNAMVAPVMQWPPEQHCWWAAYRTTMSPDTVAVRFAHAAESVGLAMARVGALGDTAWGQAGPTVLPDRQAATYAARVVAIRVADTTHFRAFVAADTRENGRLIAMCGEILRRAAVHAIAPREEEPDDSAPGWRRRP